MKSTVVFLAAFLVLSMNMMAQTFMDGFIITNTGDTLQGQLRNFYQDSKAIEVSFRKDANSSEKYYTPKDLLGYSINGEFYNSKSVKIKGESENRSFFLKRIVQGVYQLYRLDQGFNNNNIPLETSPIPSEQPVVLDDRLPKSSTSMPYNRRGAWYFIEIPEVENSILLEPQNFRETLIGVFGPCDAIQKKSKYSYTDSGVAAMVKNLADCHQLEVTPLIVITEPKSKTRFSFSVGIKSIDASSEISAFEGIDFDRTLAPTFGLFIHFPFKKGVELQTGLSFTTFSNEGTSFHIVTEFYANANEELTLDHQMNFAFISFPINLKYYPLTNSKWYVSGGVRVGRGLGNTSTTEVVSFVLNNNGDSIQIDQEKDIPERASQITKFEVGYQLATGLDLDVIEKLPLNVALTYSRGRSLNENSNGIINTFNSIGFSIGCYF